MVAANKGAWLSNNWDAHSCQTSVPRGTRRTGSAGQKKSIVGHIHDARDPTEGSSPWTRRLDVTSSSDGHQLTGLRVGSYLTGFAAVNGGTGEARSCAHLGDYRRCLE